MKRKTLYSVLCALLAAVLLTAGTGGIVEGSPAPTPYPEIQVTIDGTKLETDVPVHMTEGRTLLPVRAVAEQLGAVVGWNGPRRTVVITRGLERVSLAIGSTTATTTGGSTAALDVPAQLVNGRTLVPVRFVSEMLGAHVQWIQDSQTVRISSSFTAGDHLMFGYYLGHDSPEKGLSYNSTLNHHDKLEAAIIASYYLEGDGTWHSASYDSQALFELSAEKKLPVLALVKNAGFSRSNASALLRDSAARAAAVSNIVGIMDKGYAGVNLDFENVDPADRQYYTQFVAQLSAALRDKGYLLTLSLPAKFSDNPDHNWSGAFDYEALAPLVDYIMVMAYDHHWGDGSLQGPIAGIEWVRGAVEYSLTAVPKHKLILGVAGYAYDWIDGTRTAESMAAHEAVALAAAYRSSISWDSHHMTPYFRYSSEGQQHEVHFENERSLREKIALVEEYGLRGMALWRLGYEVPEVWEEIQRWQLGR